ncbi:hypothetical protein VUJ46_00355 [Chryseobacterium sp. MYb264]|uniref:hypothetical protein n=1 Tax=Chryseobacterium sp. MYb264 TaxID=2745153 RepID=UPI002E0FF48C|nr:hypothetical protein VUJ46_00355 [Chryseobacterium sp. MYb264]
MSSYTQSFNKVYQRSGPLFESPFKRILVESDDYLKNLIIYIHQNPEGFQNYRFSSYSAVISGAETNVRRDFVLDLFDGRENFIKSHQKEVNINFVKDLKL